MRADIKKRAGPLSLLQINECRLGSSLPKWTVRATSAFPLIATDLWTSRNSKCANIGSTGRDAAA